MPNAAFLYYLLSNPMINMSLLDKYRFLISSEELKKIDSLVFQRDRKEQLMARTMLRKALSDLTGLNPLIWQFRNNIHGRPEIEAPSDYCHLRFSVSHAGGLVACLLAWDRNVGVDVEPIQQVDRMLDIADHHFAPFEVASIRALPDDEQSRAFLELWTLKESYLKARGSGLSVPLTEAAFAVKRKAAYQIVATFGPKLADDPARWQFNLERLNSHLIAIAIERGSCSRVKIVVRDAVALMNDPQVL
jgi:4'-phosphopantetheinyl transferase